MRFEIWDSTDTNLLASGNTGNIIESSSPNWQEKGLVFQTLAQNAVILKMINNGQGGCGNDLAIDDIVFKSCGDLTIVRDAANNNAETICGNQTPYSTTLTAIPDNSVFMSHFYQWQESNDGSNWTDITGETSQNINLIGIANTSYYRAKVAESSITVNNPQCNTLSDVYTVTVDPLVTPTFTQVAAICNGETLSPLPTTSIEGITGTWSPALDNTATTIYTFTPNAGECAVNQTMTITVNPIQTPTFTQVTPICNGEILTPLPTTSNEGVTGAWSPTLDNNVTTTYTFTPDTGQCAVNQTMTITVNPLQTPTFTQVAPICNGEVLSPLPTTSIEGITGVWNPTLNNTATTTYTFTPDTGQCAVDQTITITVNPIILPTFTQVAPTCNGETLSPLPTTSIEGITGTWSPALDNTATTIYTFTPNAGECAVNQTMTITVNPIQTPTFTQVAPICNGEVLAPLPTTSNEGVTGAWSPILDNTATTTYTFNPDSGQCAVNQTMTITVNPLQTPTFTQVAPICNGEILSPLPTTSIEGVTGTWSPTLDNTATTIYTFTPDTGQCAVDQTITITVNPIVTPTFTQVAAICNGDVLSPLPTTSIEGITGTWSPALDNTTTTTYTFTPDTGQCAVNQIMTITVNPNQAPVFNPISPICNGDTLAPLPTVSLNGIPGTWSPDLNNTATTTYTFTPDPGFCPTPVNLTIIVNDNPLISLQDEYFLCFEHNGSIAFPTIMDTGLNASLYNFRWFINGLQIPGANQGTLSPISGGDYEVIAQNNISGCSSTGATVVTPIFEPEFEARVTTDAFSKNQTIEVLTLSSGVFEYMLDDKSWQDDSFFYNVSIGEHIVKVRDKRGCIEGSKTVVVMGYPKFFTPNNDGYNDTWNIVAPTSPIDYLASARILIYNRYGKLLKELNPSGEGWRGIYNGVTMPSDDYWFTVEYTDPNSDIRKLFKAHFTLKR